MKNWGNESTHKKTYVVTVRQQRAWHHINEAKSSILRRWFTRYNNSFVLNMDVMYLTTNDMFG